jgi:hypothetical protein
MVLLVVLLRELSMDMLAAMHRWGFAAAAAVLVART